MDGRKPLILSFVHIKEKKERFLLFVKVIVVQNNDSKVRVAHRGIQLGNLQVDIYASLKAAQDEPVEH